MTSNAEEWSSLASQFTMTNTDDGERGEKEEKSGWERGKQPPREESHMPC